MGGAATKDERITILWKRTEVLALVSSLNNGVILIESFKCEVVRVCLGWGPVNISWGSSGATSPVQVFAHSPIECLVPCLVEVDRR